MLVMLPMKTSLIVATIASLLIASTSAHALDRVSRSMVRVSIEKGDLLADPVHDRHHFSERAFDLRYRLHRVSLITPSW